MKIILIGPAHPLRGGLAAFNERLAAALEAAGNEVIIYSFSLQYPSILFPGKTQYTNVPAPELTIRSSINSINPINWLKVGKEISRLKADKVVIAYWISFMAPALTTIAKMIKKNKYSQIIGLMHNLIPHEKSIIDKPFTIWFIRECDAFVSLSREVMEGLKEFTNKPSVFVPHPVYDHYGEVVDKEIACSVLHINPANHYLLFFGFIRAYKGLDLLLEAMADLRIREKNIYLIIAGEYYESGKKYEEIITNNNLSEKLILHTDFIPDDRVKYYFSACDAVVQPYRTATQSGISQIAYYFEKPMIVTNVGGLPEIVPDGEAGIIVQPEANALAEGILKFYQQESGKYSAFIKMQKEKFSWPNFTKKILEI